MPQGYYTIEQWMSPKKGESPRWISIAHLPFGLTQTAAESAISKRNQPGLFRLVQMQRVIWAEKINGELRPRKSHASSPQSLAEIEQMFAGSGGRYPREQVQEARRKAKKTRSK